MRVHVPVKVKSTSASLLACRLALHTDILHIETWQMETW